MNNDAYARRAPGTADPANNLIDITPDDDNDLAIGIKALRIFNPDDESGTVAVITVLGNTVTISVPALSVWVEPLRVSRVLETGTSSELEIHGYTDSTE